MGVTPDRLRGAAKRMGDLRNRVTSILDTLETSLAAEGPAWGGDGYGSTFADGPTGYLAAHENLTEGIADTATTLASYRDGQDDAADLLERMERHSAGSF